MDKKSENLTFNCETGNNTVLQLIDKYKENL